MQNQVFEKLFALLAPDFKKFMCPFWPEFQKFMCPLFARFQAKPGLRMVKKRFSEKKAFQKWGQNRNPCLVRSFRDHVLFFFFPKPRPGNGKVFPKPRPETEPPVEFILGGGSIGQL